MSSVRKPNANAMLIKVLCCIRNEISQFELLNYKLSTCIQSSMGNTKVIIKKEQILLFVESTVPPPPANL